MTHTGSILGPNLHQLARRGKWSQTVYQINLSGASIVFSLGLSCNILLWQQVVILLFTRSEIKISDGNIRWLKLQQKHGFIDMICPLPPTGHVKGSIMTDLSAAMTTTVHVKLWHAPLTWRVTLQLLYVQYYNTCQTDSLFMSVN